MRIHKLFRKNEFVNRGADTKKTMNEYTCYKKSNKGINKTDTRGKCDEVGHKGRHPKIQYSDIHDSV